VRFKTVCFKGVVLALVVLATAALSFAGIAGTAHDLSASGWGSTQICNYCHTPHNALATLVPLWNHATTSQTFTLYGSSTLNATMAQPAGVSKACLSCHDGVTAIDSFGTQTGTHKMTGDANLGTNLSNDHPVSFLYDAALATADGGLVSPAGAAQVVAGIPLYSSQMECATCHNVHSNTYTPFLRVSNAASALCLTCHIK
jgi:predicted CXXCH cytochrome family protein